MKKRAASPSNESDKDLVPDRSVAQAQASVRRIAVTLGMWTQAQNSEDNCYKGFGGSAAKNCQQSVGLGSEDHGLANVSKWFLYCVRLACRKKS